MAMERDFLSLGNCRDSVPVTKEDNRGLFVKDSGFVDGTFLQCHYQDGSPVLYQPVPLKSSEDYNSRAEFIQPPGVFQAKPVFNDCHANYMKMFSQEMGQFLNPHSAHFNPSAHNYGSSFFQPMRAKNLPVASYFGMPVVDKSQMLRDFRQSSPLTAHSKPKENFHGGAPLNFQAVGSTPGSFLPWNTATAPLSDSQLTIFYRGAVVVYDDVPLQKAKEVMHVAGSPSQSSKAFAYPLQTERAGDEQAFSTSGPLPTIAQLQKVPKGQTVVKKALKPSTQSVTPEPYICRAIPLARKATLARFLEKRKGRLTHSMPYSKNKSIESSANFNSIDKKSSSSQNTTKNVDSSHSRGN